MVLSNYFTWDTLVLVISVYSIGTQYQYVH